MVDATPSNPQPVVQDSPQRRIGEVLALAALALLVVASTFAPIANNDIFLQLRNGRVILETWSIPLVDDFSALARGRPWPNHEWLAAVLFRLIEQSFSLDGLIVFKVAVGLGVAATLYASARKLGASVVIAAAGLALVMVLAGSRMLERPHVLTFLFCALFLLLLARRRMGDPTPLWAFLPLQVLWANLHGGFVLGPLIVGLAAAGAAADGILLRFAFVGAETPATKRHFREALRLALLAAALVAASLANPLGPRLFSFAFGLTSSAFMGVVYEWLPPFRSSFATSYAMRFYLVWLAFGASVWLTASAASVLRRELPPSGVFGALLFAAFFALSLRMNRNVVDFGLVTLPSVTAAATWLLPGRVRDSRPLPALLGLAGALLVIAGDFVLHGYLIGTGRRLFRWGLDRNIPVAAVDFLAAKGLQGGVFTDYSAGAYLVYRLYPAVRVGMDSRNEVYGEELFRDYQASLSDSRALATMLQTIDAKAVFLSFPRPALKATPTLESLGGWRLAYADDQAWIFLPDPTVPPTQPGGAPAEP